MTTPKTRFDRKTGNFIVSLRALHSDEEEQIAEICSDPDFRTRLVRIRADYSYDVARRNGRPTDAQIKTTLNHFLKECRELHSKLWKLPDDSARQFREQLGENDFTDFAHALEKVAVLPLNGAPLCPGRRALTAQAQAAQQIKNLFTDYNLPFAANTWPDAQPTPAETAVKIVLSGTGRVKSRESIAALVQAAGIK